ncbi:MAG: hypothetical protein HY841_07330 [Bacteroidetes bacterium]|nr:hypothetical protein [Bacteroidota bacterium]
MKKKNKLLKNLMLSDKMKLIEEMIMRNELILFDEKASTLYTQPDFGNNNLKCVCKNGKSVQLNLCK